MNAEREIHLKPLFTLTDVETVGIINIREQMKRIYKIYDGFGLDINIQTERAKIVWNHIQNLLKDVYSEENTFYELYVLRIQNYKKKIAELCNVLKMTPRKLAVVGSWIAQEEMLSQELCSLTEKVKLMNEEKERTQKKFDLAKPYPCILNLQTELVQLWDKCYVSQSERDKFPYLYSRELSTEVLEALKSEVDKWKKHSSKVEHILKNIEKRELHWGTFHALDEAAEEAANDPNRFRSSKRNFVKEFRERMKLEKDLLALEHDIFGDIESLGSTFLYNGKDFKTYVANQWNERNQKKEIKKVEKRNKQSAQFGNEAVVKTPLKRTSSVNFEKSSQPKLLRSKTLYNDDNFKTYVSKQRAKSSNQKLNDSHVHKKHCVKQSKDVNFATPLKRTVAMNFAKTAPSKIFNSLKTMSPFNVNHSKVVPSTVSRMTSKPNIRPAYLLRKK